MIIPVVYIPGEQIDSKWLIHAYPMLQVYTGWWFLPTPLKNDGVRRIGSSSQLLGKIKFMFQTIHIYSYIVI